MHKGNQVTKISDLREKRQSDPKCREELDAPGAEFSTAKNKLKFLRRAIAVGMADAKAGRFAMRTVDQIFDGALRRHRL